MRIERRLRQPRWLLVAVPACSLVFAFFATGIVLLATGHDALSSYRQIFDAAFLNSGALGQTLIAATPLAFTGLAAAAAFRMRLFNIGAEGQLYVGAITAAAAGLYLGGKGGPSAVAIAGMVVGRLRRRRALGADPGDPAGVLQDERDHHVADAQLRRRVPADVPDLQHRVVLA